MHANGTVTIVVENTDDLSYIVQDQLTFEGFFMDYKEDYESWAQGDIMIVEFLIARMDNWADALTFASNHGDITEQDEDAQTILITAIPF